VDVTAGRERIVSQLNPFVKYMFERGVAGDNIRDTWRERYLIPETGGGITPRPKRTAQTVH